MVRVAIGVRCQDQVNLESWPQFGLAAEGPPQLHLPSVGPWKGKSRTEVIG